MTIRHWGVEHEQDIIVIMVIIIDVFMSALYIYIYKNMYVFIVYNRARQLRLIIHEYLRVIWCALSVFMCSW